ncbi:hypothetical protein HPB47_000384 [Ixodes persulcatus]|uniref:Uncharacterized protein n=1 Tax=Ixodes persulcatus TaxID=34615 RepID=A0AC60PRW1_IXOPE|nr:hypothetical protein HPB47_000384 [Ixodes persulcatus]
MAEKATPEDKERCVADGVDVPRRLPGQSMKGWNNMHIIDYFKDNDLKLLTSDKEGGFVVVTRDMFAERSQQAILKNFKKELQCLMGLPEATYWLAHYCACVAFALAESAIILAFMFAYKNKDFDVVYLENVDPTLLLVSFLVFCLELPLLVHLVSCVTKRGLYAVLLGLVVYIALPLVQLGGFSGIPLGVGQYIFRERAAKLLSSIYPHFALCWVLRITGMENDYTDAEPYTLFAGLFNPVIEDYHGGFKATNKHSLTDFGDLSTLGYPFNPCLTEAQYREMEEKVSSTLRMLDSELKATYYPLTGMGKKTQQQLIDDHFLFKDGDRFLQAAIAAIKTKLECILNPSGGVAVVCGYDVVKNTALARSSIGLCQQTSVFFPDLTVREHLVYFGKVVILDEPSAGLDSENKRGIWDLLLGMRSKSTLIISTHDMEEADILADRIIVMADGRALCSGSPAFLKKAYVEKRVAISLYRLCSTAEERTIAHLFAVGQSVVNESYREFCDVVIEELEARTVSMIRNEDLEHHMREFQAVLGFPNAIGALDGCHLPVSPPKDSAVDYRNYKGWYSVILLALVDHRYLFRYISVGSPGKCHDANVYGRSPLGRLLEDYQVAVPRSIGGTEIPPIVLCDQAFPLTRNLMKPFPHSLSPPQDEGDYNYALSKARRVVENAFGRLKARFRIVLKRMEVRIDNVNAVVRACCILHNVCETLNDSADKQWIQDARKVEEDDKLEQPSRKTTAKTDSGTAVRTALVAYFGANPPPKRNQASAEALPL